LCSFFSRVKPKWKERKGKIREGKERKRGEKDRKVTWLTLDATEWDGVPMRASRSSKGVISFSKR